MGVMLEHIHQMDNKVEELCGVIRAMGGDVCTDNLHAIKAEDFADTGIDPVVPQQGEVQDDFDPKI